MTRFACPPSVRPVAASSLRVRAIARGEGLPRPRTVVRSRAVATGEKDSAKSDARKQSLYFPEYMLEEIKQEAARLDRPLSWVVQRAWKMAKGEIRRLPSIDTPARR